MHQEWVQTNDHYKKYTLHYISNKINLSVMILKPRGTKRTGYFDTYTASPKLGRSISWHLAVSFLLECLIL